MFYKTTSVPHQIEMHYKLFAATWPSIIIFVSTDNSMEKQRRKVGVLFLENVND